MKPAALALAALALAAGCAADGRVEGRAASASGCEECPPPMPPWLCDGGGTGGPTGRCLLGEDGRCAWEIRECQAKLCGGIAAFRCPDGFECVDDPRDDCDPARGGADCGGLCTPR